MKRAVLGVLLCCLLLGGAARAANLLPEYEGEVYYWDVLRALLEDSDSLTERAIGGTPIVLMDLTDVTHIGACGNVEIENNIMGYHEDGEADARQGILVLFRINNDSGLWFEFSARDCANIVMDLTAPQFPAVGMSAQPEKYRHFGSEAFTFAEGEWYVALFAVDPSLELGLYLWQDGDPHNMAWYRTNLARDDWYADGADFKDRSWELYMDMSYVDAVDIDIAGYSVINFSGFRE